MGTEQQGNGGVSLRAHRSSVMFRPRDKRMSGHVDGIIRSQDTPHVLIQNGKTVSRSGLWPAPFHRNFPHSCVQNDAARAATPPLQATPNALPRNRLPCLSLHIPRSRGPSPNKAMEMSYLGNPRKYDLVPSERNVSDQPLPSHPHPHFAPRAVTPL